MDYSQPEVKIINQSIKFVNRWHWYKYVLLVTLILLIYFCGYLFFSSDYTRFSSLIGVPTGLIIGYLARNWSKPKKEVLLLKLVKAQKRT